MNETAVDLAAAVSLVSAVTDRPVPKGLIAFGEIGLGGEVRAVTNIVQRISESARLGFTTCVLPQSCLAKLKPADYSIDLIGISHVNEIAKLLNVRR